MLVMDTVVDLLEWRRSKADAGHQHGDVDVERLERAIRRLDSVATHALESGRALEPRMETELLAIMGALSMDLFGEASERAERLADRVTRSRRSAGK